MDSSVQMQPLEHRQHHLPCVIVFWVMTWCIYGG
jgi:hypothetical protein